ncbi:hypothetical protein AAWM_07093 [Aspergillus awamori]|uniref:Uncharacterized protein n=1 Tax=Aspergillus awamori TaxID=105351 RepID=A0A401KY01_ASPAW|nr:hypothetical protein AAWM_07093 [Aspergillus awamori]GKZ52154.1 hypothetical protein AnigIFM49718_000026 [Aspergillus niger]GLA13410.1 hypothetical protein AnigIFM62618_010399 [Aspergillus niger]GLA43757.1 hypothetical protein AnigIFM63309_001852 [Aspergillus niger]
MERQLPTRGVRILDTQIAPERHGVKREYHDPSTPSADSTQVNEGFKFLAVPTETDDLEATCTKLKELAKTVEQGNSLALFTGLKLATYPSKSDPESVAMSQLTPEELWMYETWKEMKMIQDAESTNGDRSCGEEDRNGMKLPYFDWEQNVAPVPQGAQSLKRFTQRAAAMDVVFGHQGATPENASWLTSHMIFMLPLVKAVTKITNIKKNLKNNHQSRHTRGLTDMEAAEVETARKLVAIATKNRAREMEKIRRLTKSIEEDALIIRGRAEALERSRHTSTVPHR